MKKIIITLMLLGCALLGTATPTQAKAINVVTTTADLKSVAEYIGGDKVNVYSLGKGNQNYHFLFAKPSYMIKAKKADLFIRVGLDLEMGYESLILEGSRNPDIRVGRPGHLDASEGITPLDIPDKVDRSMGDIHAGGNPHYWLDPLNMKIVASNIAQRLSQLSEGNASYFQNNLSEFNRKLDEKMRDWTKTLAHYDGEKLVSYHQSWTYFAHRFGLEIVEELEPKPGVPPSPTHLKSVVNLVKKQNIKVILNENIYKNDAAEYVAERTEARVVVAPISVGGVKEVNSYFSLIDTIVQRLVRGFEQ